MIQETVWIEFEGFINELDTGQSYASKRFTIGAPVVLAPVHDIDRVNASKMNRVSKD